MVDFGDAAGVRAPKTGLVRIRGVVLAGRVGTLGRRRRLQKVHRPRQIYLRRRVTRRRILRRTQPTPLRSIP